MIKRKIKTITIEYEDADVDTIAAENMYHVARQNYRKGATKPEHGFTTNVIAWDDPTPLKEG